MKAEIKYIPNILSEEGRFYQSIDLRPGISLKEALDKSEIKYEGLRVIHNSEKADDLESREVFNGDIIIVTSEIKWQAVVAAAQFVWAAFIEHWVTWTLFIIATAYSVYSYLNAPTGPMLSIGEGLDEDSPTSSWDGIRTTQDVGLPIAVIYGEHKVGGNIINQYVSTDGDKNYLNMLICLGEGEIESISDIKINDNPYENYDGITIAERLGTYDQTVIPNFSDLHNVYTLNWTLTQNNAVTHTTINDDVEAFELTFNLPNGLFQTGSNGSILSWAVDVKVEYKLSTAGSWTDLGTSSYSAKSRSAVKRVFRKEGLTAGRYDIRITRTSADSSLEPIKNGDLILLNVDEIKTDDLSYPNLALLGIRALATDQLSGSTPNVTSIVKGRKIRIPKVTIFATGEEQDWADYYWDPDYDSGNGAYRLFSDDTVLYWDDETYVDRWCANPIWCIRDLLINDRYGLGNLITTDHIAESDYLEMSRICEQKVSDGDGGYEKKYRLDVVIDSKTKALDLLVQLASSFDAFIFYSEGLIKMKIDTDDDPVQIFGVGNIVQGSMTQAWKSKKEAFNVINVQFMDKDKDYAWETISIMDDESIALGNTIREKTVRCFVTRASYALRAGEKALLIAQNIDQSVSFKAGIGGIAVSPGDVIGFSHDVPQIGFSGRIEAGSTTSSIKLDRSVTIEAGSTYHLTIQFADDTIETKEVSNSPGTTDTITVSEAFSQAPAAYDVYSFGVQNINYKKYRVIGCNIDDNLSVALSCIEMSSAVYSLSDAVIPETNYSALTLTIPDVESLTLSEMVVIGNSGDLINTIEVYWQKPDVTDYRLNNFVKAKVFISDDSGESWIEVGETTSEKLIINENIVTGQTYMIAVVSCSSNGMQNAIADSPQDSITIQGKEAAPSNVENFNVEQRGDTLRFSWDPIPDGDLARYIIKKGSEWTTAQLIAEKVDVTEFEYPVGTVGSETYLIKAVDTSGNESDDPASDEITVTPPPEMNFAVVLDPWNVISREYKLSSVSIEKRNFYDSSYVRDVFALTTSETWEEKSGGWDALAAAGDLTGEGTYEASGSIEQPIDQAFDLGTTFVFNVITDMNYRNVTGGSLTVQISTSEDGSSWSAFADVSASTNYRARYVRFKYILQTSDTTQNIYFYSGTVYINAANVKVDYGRDVAIVAGGTAISFRDDFTATPRVTSIIITSGTAIAYEIVSISASGMTVKLKDISGSYVTGEINWEAKGS